MTLHRWVTCAVSVAVLGLGVACRSVKRGDPAADEADRRVARLAAAAGDADPRVRRSAAGALAEEPRGKALDLLRRLRTDPDEQVRALAVGALGAGGQARDLEALVSALEDRALRVRVAAIQAMGRLGSPRGLAATAALLKDPYAQIAARDVLLASGDQVVEALAAAVKDSMVGRQEAGRLLCEINTPKAVQALRALMGHPDRRVRLDVLAWASGMDESVRDEVTALAARDADPEVRLAAVPGLQRQSKVPDALLGLLGDTDRNVLWAALKAARHSGDNRLVAPLCALLKHPDQAVRWHAATQLNHFSDMAALAPLLAAAESPDSDLQRLALEALTRLPNPKSVETLARLLGHRDERVVSLAVRNLANMDSLAAVEALLAGRRTGSDRIRNEISVLMAGHAKPTALAVLVEMLKGPNSDLRQRAAVGMGRIGGPVALKALVEAMNDADLQVRCSAVSGIGAIGTDEAVPALVLAIRDAAAGVQEAAFYGLARIAGQPTGAKALGALVAAAGDTDERIAGTAVRHLMEMKRADVAAPVLRFFQARKLAWPPESNQRFLDYVFRFGGPEGQALLCEALKKSDVLTRRHAAGLLARAGGPEAKAALAEAAVDTNAYVARAAAEALALLDPKAAFEPLVAALARSRTAYLAEAMQAAGKTDVVEALLAASASKDFSVRRESVSYLGHLGDRRAIAPLEALARSESPTLRLAALRSLQDLRRRLGIDPPATAPSK